MTSFQRMIVIPQEEYLALSSIQSVKEPLKQHFQSLEKQYLSEENERDPYRRMVLQSSTLDQMKQVKEHMRNSLLISTPKPYQNRAKALFQTVEGFIRFNDKGEFYSYDGNIIRGSRIEDLIQHAVRDRRRNMTPTGWSDFLTILREHNVPKSILNRDTLDELENKVSHISRPVKRDPDNIMQMTQSPQRRRQPPRAKKPSSDDLKFLKSYRNG